MHNYILIKDHVIKSLTKRNIEKPENIKSIFLIRGINLIDNYKPLDIDILLSFKNISRFNHKDILNSIKKYPNETEIIKNNLNNILNINPITKKLFTFNMVGSYELRKLNNVKDILHRAIRISRG